MFQRRYFIAGLTLLFVALACAVRLVRRTSSERTQPPIVRQGVAWTEWLKTPDAAAVDKRLKDALTQAINHWTERGAAVDSFGVLRAVSKERKSAAFSCHPFEKQHPVGRAADMWVGDLNRDGLADLTDLCLFATTLDDVKGGCGVYGGSALWVHVDVSGTTDRWGESRIPCADVQRSSGSIAPCGRRRGESHVACADVQPVVWSKRQRSVRDRCRAWGLTPNRRTLQLVVRKQPSVFVFDTHKQSLSVHPSLRLYVGKRMVKVYPIALGFDPVGDKEKRDDYRTPEGAFYICGKNAKSQFHKSLHLSYPNAEDAKRGLKDKLINKTTYNAIVRAIEKKRTPPQHTALGGDVMLHGGGGARDPWTWGCIALDDDDVDELYELAPLGTTVTVLPVGSS